MAVVVAKANYFLKSEVDSDISEALKLYVEKDILLPSTSESEILKQLELIKDKFKP